MSPRLSILISLLLVSAGILGRILPHAPNMTPITAITLFSATYLGTRYALTIFTVTMIATDLYFGFYQWQIMAAVYISFGCAIALGWFIRKHFSTYALFSSVFFSSLLFFIITNWAVWYFGTMYEHSFSGLMLSYEMGIPFFKNSLAGDYIYSGLFFGVFESARYFYDSKPKAALIAGIVK